MAVRFNLKFPYPLALRDIAVSIQLRKKGAYDGPKDNAKVDQGAPILNGIGPYKVVAFESSMRVVVERFDDYYKDSPKGRPAIKRIVFRAIPGWGSQQAELLSGDVDWMYNVPSDIARSVGAMGRAQYLNGPSMRIGFIPMDAANVTGSDNNPFAKLDVRRAMIHAIDREALVRQVVKANSKVIHSACHPMQFGCTQDVMKYNHDSDKARQLLKAAGHPNGFTFKFWVYRELPVAKAIIADLAKVGIKARLTYVAAGKLARARRRRDIAAYFATWGSGGTADTAAIASRHWPVSSNRNLSGDKEVEKYMMAAQRTRNPQKRKELYAKGLRLIAERAYWVPLYAFSLNYLTSNDLDFPVPRDGQPRLYRAKWK